ncbi:MAG: outer membrane lipoprotein carrier protein LolA [Pseudomonadota bacterium]
MLTAAISTLALALTLGPQLQLGLQVALDEAQPSVETSADTDPVIEAPEIVSETEAEEAPAIAEPMLEEVINPQPSDKGPLAETDTNAPDGTEPVEPLETQVSEHVESEPAEGLIEPIPAAPSDVQSGELPADEWPTILAATSSALSAAKTAKGNFIQSNPDGSVATGTFALNRPGRMRFDYDDPTPVLIVSDGTTVAMEDSELETVDRAPIGSTPLGLILSTDLNVDEDVEVLSVMQNADRYGVRVEDASGELEGTLTMVFDKASYELLGWLATDGNLRTTVVDLTDVETNVRVDPRLFRLDETEDEEEER